MTIGSTPEVGVLFSQWGVMSMESRQQWFTHMTTVWGNDLCGGYATLIDVRTLGLMEALDDHAQIPDPLEAPTC